MFNELDNIFNKVDPEYKTAPGFGTIEGLVWGIANLMIGIGVSVALIMLAYAFIQFLMTEGDPKRMATARNAALWSIVAFVVATLAYGIKSALFNTVGLE